MIDNVWFCEPNDARESWCFLTMKIKKPDANNAIASWEVCYANPNKIIRKVCNNDSSEEDLIRGILYEIYYCRKKEIMMITYEKKLIPLLRTRIFYHGFCEVSLRSLKVSSVQDILQKYFFFDNNDNVVSISDFVSEMKNPLETNTLSEILYLVFKRIGPLLPAGVV